MIHLTATKTLEDHRNVSDALSKLRDIQQKKLDVLFKDVCVLATGKNLLGLPISSVECERLFSVAVSVDAQQASLGCITSSFL